MSFHVILLDIIFIVIFPTLVSSVFLFLIHGFFILTERAFCQRLLRRFCPNSNFIVREHSEYSQNGVDTGLAIEAGCEGLTTEERRQIFALVLKDRPHTAIAKSTDVEKDGAPGRCSLLTSNTTMSASSEEPADSSSDVDICCDDDVFADRLTPDGPKDTEKGSGITTDKPGVPLNSNQSTDDISHQVLETSFSPYGDDEEEDGCAICLADYKADDSILCAKHCTHQFHKECLLLWLEKKDVCPFCREPMLTAEEMKWAQQQLLSAQTPNTTKTGWRKFLSVNKTLERLSGIRSIVSRTVDRALPPSLFPETSGNVLVQESDTAEEVEIILLRTSRGSRTRTTAEI